jgi:hypothetical protein
VLAHDAALGRVLDQPHPLLVDRCALEPEGGKHRSHVALDSLDVERELGGYFLVARGANERRASE